MPKGPYQPSKILARIRQSARRLGYKTTWVDAENERLLRVDNGKRYALFGSGWYPMWPINSAVTHRLSMDKELSARLLAKQGLAVPPTVHGYIDPVLEPGFIKRPVPMRDAIKSCSLPLPLVVKPNNGSCGQGITVVQRKSDLKAAVDIAARYDNHILIQGFVEGDDYRVYVLEGKPLALVQRVSRPLVSDGKRTVAQHLAEVRDFWRTHDGGKQWSYESYVKRYGTRVFPAGTPIDAYPVTNRSRGGAIAAVTAQVPAVWGQLSCTALAALGLQFGAVDFRVDSAGRAVVIEVNGSPNMLGIFATDEALGRRLMDRLVKRVIARYSLPLPKSKR